MPLEWCIALPNPLMDNAKRQDNLTVLMWLVRANKLVGNRPDKVSLFLYIDSGTLL